MASSNLKGRVELLLTFIAQNPYAFSQPFEILTDNLKGFISRRINKQHRLVYEVLEAEKIIKVLRI
ncbi:MAG: Txe/YoeB family addiction module toxin [Ignavibacterium sp.]|nr:Txe/YoeB family addiction module toxin [Ignavibacterium sp.]